MDVLQQVDLILHHWDTFSVVLPSNMSVHTAFAVNQISILLLNNNARARITSELALEAPNRLQSQIQI